MRLLLLALLILLPAAAHAEVPLTGTFTATNTCPAYLSISKQTNPGSVMVRPGQAYQALAANKTLPTHYRLAMPGRAPEPRWVAVTCGAIDGQAATLPPTVTAKPPIAHPGTHKPYVLAVSWQPAFCEARPDTAECRSQTPARYDATHFALHGLWPEPRSNEFCGVSAADIANSERNWRALPQIDLSTGLRARLDRLMPGTRSQLERHEWIRHGTCYGAGAERYFSDSVALMDQLNGSAVAALFSGNIGRPLSLRAIRQAFDQSFRPGAGQRVQLECDDDGNRPLITELSISLAGAPGEDRLATLIGNARTVDSGCAGGIVDPAGRQ